MAQKDWNEIIEKFNEKNESYLKNFLAANDSFCPSENFANIFESENPFSNFSSKNLDKAKPGNWIPIYKKEDLADFLLLNSLMPIRSGQGEFFFYKGKIIFDLTTLVFQYVDMSDVKQIEDYIPLSLRSNFQRNENAFLNKAMALGILNHFVANSDLKVLEKKTHTKNGSKMLYGQFGKIKTTFDLTFRTSRGCKLLKSGFQFEMDLVLESKDEIFIFEAKSSQKKTETFALLQLYYPLIYLQFITIYRKKIRTIFIDITATENQEIYRLIEFDFKDSNFDEYEVVKKYQYEVDSSSDFILDDIIDNIIKNEQ